jgi:predicted PP-loop superfamily ATPase
LREIARSKRMVIYTGFVNRDQAHLLKYVTNRLIHTCGRTEEELQKGG